MKNDNLRVTFWHAEQDALYNSAFPDIQRWFRHMQAWKIGGQLTIGQGVDGPLSDAVQEVLEPGRKHDSD